MSTTTPTSTPRSARKNYSRFIPFGGLAVRVLVFTAAVLLVAAIQGAVFLW